jgi:hypothetical protein
MSEAVVADQNEYSIMLTMEEFKITIENARNAPSLKSDSKSGKMILKRPIQNINKYEHELSNFEKINVKLSLYGEPMYNSHSAYGGKIFQNNLKHYYLSDDYLLIIFSKR